ncbi:hypothetical protein [Halorussus pelagicus]|uniref:hypothetical protein n=1 Tax=Halorussus pelagicus TaxID=2505977 RepID=UPI000FFBB5E1|nr:hypothetical protein [Halorussus pelagicus]
MTRRSFVEDDRAIGYHIVIALFVLGAFALTFAFIGPIFDKSQEMAVNRSADTRYEGYASNGIGYMAQARHSMPFLVMILVTVFLFGKAVLLSSRRY